MIDNPRKVKDLIKNLAKGDSGKAQLLQRRYAMERFLERVAESEYKGNLVLKGGMLVTSMLDIGQRMTRGTDVTMQDKALDVESAVKMTRVIAAIPLADGMAFDVEDAYEIMEDSEYGGVRIEMRAHLGKTEIPMKLDISTGDAITPSAINYAYRLMLEDRDIDILAYNMETVLAEKIETMLVRSTLNTRMRDFYDMWALANMGADIDYGTLAEAVAATAKARGHDIMLADCESVVDALAASEDMAGHWKRYQNRNDFAAGLSWEDALDAVRMLCNGALSP
ncbi:MULTISPECIES: nucleotidyl transferase AbiEii/AbiGii toxin family protein [unclassified Adlercreutzia]|uniref:nucleotidyl transferase AbiEii/AbiGii toxin family protein n=1 Tax=unclassified Adlercreutzia TaxID=2636013 RepID=UPI0013ED53EF|nr:MULTISPECIES: nucleotidyl transferase AbiEii/AbiGii toxin family protein [unclassified Adlercreutzia]